MKTELLSYPQPVQMPSNKHDWQLYTDMPGCAAVANRLTYALRKLIKTTTPDQLRDGWAEFQAVQDKHARFGASDTEPRNVALAVLDKVYGEDHVRTQLGY